MCRAKKTETLPTCLSDQLNRLVKFQHSSSTRFGFRAFQSFRRPCFCWYTLQHRSPEVGDVHKPLTLAIQDTFVFFSELHNRSWINKQENFTISCRFATKLGCVAQIYQSTVLAAQWSHLPFIFDLYRLLNHMEVIVLPSPQIL